MTEPDCVCGHPRTQHKAAEAADRALRERDQARAELGAVQRELEQARAQRDVAATGMVRIAESVAAEVLYAYDAWQCLRPDGCGSRYTTAEAAADHEHPLTPVRVTVTRRPG